MSFQAMLDGLFQLAHQTVCTAATGLGAQDGEPSLDLVQRRRRVGREVGVKPQSLANQLLIVGVL